MQKETFDGQADRPTRSGSRLTVASCVLVLLPVLLSASLLLMYMLSRYNWAYLVMLLLAAPPSCLLCGGIGFCCSLVAVKRQKANTLRLVLLVLSACESVLGGVVLLALLL